MIINLSKKSKVKERSDILKIVAIVTMLIDHIGLFLYPDVIILRIIGRISFPLFAYHIAIGYKNTSNVIRYLARLFAFALISQVPYSIAIGGFNIFFILFLGLLVIKYYEDKSSLKVVLIFIGVFILEGSSGFSYGIYGVFLPLIFHIYSGSSNLKSLVLAFLIINVAYCITRGQVYQMFSLMAIPFIYYDWKVKVEFNRYFYYGFYPTHILVLFIISKL